MDINSGSQLAYYYAQYALVYHKRKKVIHKLKPTSQIERVSNIAKSRNDCANSRKKA